MPVDATVRQNAYPVCRPEACHPLPCHLRLPGVPPPQGEAPGTLRAERERGVRKLPILSHCERVDTWGRGGMAGRVFPRPRVVLLAHMPSSRPRPHWAALPRGGPLVREGHVTPGGAPPYRVPSVRRAPPWRGLGSQDHGHQREFRHERCHGERRQIYDEGPAGARKSSNATGVVNVRAGALVARPTAGVAVPDRTPVATSWPASSNRNACSVSRP